MLTTTKPLLQFKNLHIIPQTPNLQYLKQKKMKNINSTTTTQKHDNFMTPKSFNRTIQNKENNLFSQLAANTISEKQNNLTIKSSEKIKFFNLKIAKNKSFFADKQNKISNERKNKQYSNKIATKIIHNQQNGQFVFKDSNIIRDHNCNLEQNSQQNHFKKNINGGQRQYKSAHLERFKQNVDIFYMNLGDIQEQFSGILEVQLKNIGQQLSDTKQAFNELNKILIQSQQKLIIQLQHHRNQITTFFKQKIKQINQIKASLFKYNTDINKHYNEIIQQLALQQFDDIMWKYNRKVEYFQQNIQNAVNLSKQYSGHHVVMYVPIINYFQNLTANISLVNKKSLLKVIDAVNIPITNPKCYIKETRSTSISQLVQI